MPEAETVRSEEPVHPRGASPDGGYDDFPTGSYAKGPPCADDDYDKSYLRVGTGHRVGL